MARPLEARVDMRVAEGLLKLISGAHTPTAKRIGKKLFYKFAGEVRDDFRANAPRDRGKLVKAIKARTTKYGGAQVGVDKGRAPHWFFKEGGTKARKTKAGANRGKVEGNQWITKVRKRAQARYPAAVVNPLLRELMGQINKGIRAK